MTKCACGKDGCKNEVTIDASMIHFYDSNGKSRSGMYLSPNSIIELIRELRRELERMSNE